VLKALLARLNPTVSADASSAAARLRRLDREMDQEQALQFGAAALGFVGAMLSLTLSSVFVLLPACAIAMLTQYRIQGWCPPLALLARLGLRSSAEIEGERYALAAAVDDAREPHFSAAPAEAD
jgi:hypothetical protein